METQLVGRGLVEILPDFKKWGAQLAGDMRLARTQLDGSAAGLRRSAGSVGRSMAAVGKGTTVLGLGVAAVSVKMAADFQAHTAVLQTAAGETSKGLAVVRQGIKDIAVGTGTGIKNLTDGMYLIEKAGFRGSDGLKVLKAAAQGAREENAKLSDVTNAMTSIMASYHLKANASVQVMNAMKTAAGEGKITMEEFSGAMSTVLPIASANKISFEQVAGAVATLTQHGTSAREATHELGATIRALAAPNNVAIREMSRFGLSSVDVSTKLGQRGLTGTINLLTTTILHKMGPGGKILLSSFEGTKQSAEDARIMISKMPADLQKAANSFLAGKIQADDWNATIKGAPVAAQPMLKNFNTLVNRSKGFSNELKKGGPAAKTYTDALKKMSGGAIGMNTILQLSGESFGGFQERVKKVGESLHHNTKDVEGWKITSGLLNVQMDKVKAMVQVLAIDIGTKLIPVVSAVVGYFVKHRNVLIGLVAAFGGFIAVTSAAYIVMKLYSLWTGTAAAATAVFNAAVAIGARYALGTRIQLAALFVQEKLIAIWGRVAAAAQWALNAAMDANPIGLIVIAIAALVAVVVLIATKTQWFQKLWGWIWGGIRKPVMAFVGWLKGNWPLILAILTGPIGLAVLWIVRHWDGVKHVFSAFVGWLKSNWQLVVWTILTGGIGLAVAMIVRHWDGVKHAFSVTVDWLKNNWPLILAILTGPVGIAVLMIVRHWDGVKHAFSASVSWLKNNWPLILAILTGPIGLAVLWIVRNWGKITDGAKNVYHAVTGWFARTAASLIQWAMRVPGRIASFFSALPGAIGHWFIETASTIGRWAASTAAMLGQWILSLPGKVILSGVKWSLALRSAGGSLIQGLISGAASFFTKTLPAWARSVKDGIVSFFKAVFGIHSPSTVMAEIGRALMQGLFSGIAAVAATVVGFLNVHVVAPITGFFRSTIPAAASLLKDRVIGYWTLLRTGVTAVYNALTGRVFAPLGNFFTKTIPGWAATLRAAVVSRWNALLTALAGVYTGLRNRVFAPIGNFFTKTIPGWATSLRTAVTSRWNALLASLAGVYTGLRNRVFAPIGNFFTRTIPGWAGTLRTAVVGRWNSLLTGLGGVYTSIRNRVFAPIGTFFTKTIPGWASTLKTKVVGFFSSMRDGIGRVWTGIESKTKGPVNWVLKHVWNEGLVSVWKKITGWIGIGNALKPVKLLASGGTVGTAPAGVFNRPTAIVGEGSRVHPEYVIPTDPKYRSRAMALWQSAGAHFYKDGGILGDIAGAVGKAAGGAASLGKGAVGFFTDPAGEAKKLLKAPLKLMSHIGNSPWAQMIKTLPNKAVDGLIKAVEKAGSSLLSFIGPSGGSVGSGVRRWSNVVHAALIQAGQPASLTEITLKRMQQESGGNPTIVNRTDSNWKAGHPSVGLMQVIGPTFQHYAGKYRNTGPFSYGVSTNPLANVYSSMKYALAAYGSLPAAYGRKGGYANGTAGADGGWHWVGEHGPELAKLPAGTRIRSARDSVRTASAAVVHLTVENHGVIGSRQETENWLAASLDQLRRRGRLPAALGGRA